MDHRFARVVPVAFRGLLAVVLSLVGLTGFGLPARADSGGIVVGWGYDSDGQATAPAGLSGVTAVAGGLYHSLALKSDGTVVAWGYDGDGQSTVPAGLSGVSAIAAGLDHSLAVKSDGTVVAWGYDDDGQATAPAGLSGVTAVAGGLYHSLALKSDGTVVAWGDNSDGQSTVPAGLSGVSAIAAGAYHSLALKSDGTVVAWGDNSDGQSTVPAGLSGVTAVAAGLYHSLALKSDGTVVGWGYSGDGQATAPAGLSGVSAIAAGAYHSLALKSDGTVVAWGDNGDEQSTVPAGLSGVSAIAAGAYHSLAVAAPALESQSITFDALDDKYLGQGSVSVSALGSSGLPVSFASSTPGVCTVSGTSVTLVNPGTCTVVASQAGNVRFSAAENVEQSFIVDPNNPPQPASLTRTGATLEWPAVRRVTQYYVMYRQVGSGKPWGVYATGASSSVRTATLTNPGTRQRCSAANSTAGYTNCAMPYGWKRGVNYEFVVYGKNTLGRTTMLPLNSQLSYVAP